MSETIFLFCLDWHSDIVGVVIGWVANGHDWSNCHSMYWVLISYSQYHVEPVIDGCNGVNGWVHSNDDCDAAGGGFQDRIIRVKSSDGGASLTN